MSKWGKDALQMRGGSSLQGATANCSGMSIVLIQSPARQKLHTAQLRRRGTLVPFFFLRVLLRNPLSAYSPCRPQQLLFTPLTDMQYSEGPIANKERWTVCVQLITRLLTSWTGLLFLAADQLGLKTFVSSLRLPNEDLHVRIN